MIRYRSSPNWLIGKVFVPFGVSLALVPQDAVSWVDQRFLIGLDAQEITQECDRAQVLRRRADAQIPFFLANAVCRSKSLVFSLRLRCHEL